MHMLNIIGLIICQVSKLFNKNKDKSDRSQACDIDCSYMCFLVLHLCTYEHSTMWGLYLRQILISITFFFLEITNSGAPRPSHTHCCHFFCNNSTT